MAVEEQADTRYATNPLFNANRMKLGVFGANVSNGCAITLAEGRLETTWPNTKRIAMLADRAGLEAMVPVARWKGFGGPTNFNGSCFETYTWAAGVAGVTEHTGVFSTSHVPTVHPIMAAKQGTTIDHISGGRFALNLVMGWVTPEMEIFGGEQRQHDERCAFGQEWLDYFERLWSEKGSFDFNGQYFHGRDVEAYPKPMQGPRPALFNAGNSKAGIEFSSRNGDINFASLETLENMKAYTSALKEKARTEYNREIQTMTYGLVVCRDTEAEAKAAFQQVVDEGDWGAAGNVIKIAGSGSSESFDHAVREMQERFIAGWGGYPIVGTPEQVTEELGRLNEAGMDGMIMGLIDYNEELKYFGEKVLPLMVQAGIRH